jgi:hypothetical protein
VRPPQGEGPPGGRSTGGPLHTVSRLPRGEPGPAYGVDVAVPVANAEHPAALHACTLYW